MNEHDGTRERTAFFDGVTEEEIVVVFQAHATQNDDVDLCLQRDARKQGIVGLTGRRKDRQLLGFHERVEHVDHRNTGTNHLLRDDALGRVDGGAADVDQVVREGRALVTGLCATGEDATEQILGERHLHGVSQEPDLGVSGDAAGAGKDLERHFVAFESDDLGERCAVARGDLGKFAILHAFGANVDHVACDILNAVIDLMHCLLPPRA